MNRHARRTQYRKWPQKGKEALKKVLKNTHQFSLKVLQNTFDQVSHHGLGHLINELLANHVEVRRHQLLDRFHLHSHQITSHHITTHMYDRVDITHARHTRIKKRRYTRVEHAGKYFMKKEVKLCGG